MAYLLKKRRSALPTPREKGRMAMATFLLSSVKSCEGGHCLCHHLLEKRRSALLALRRTGAMTMVIFFLSALQSCGCDNSISSKEEEV